MDFFIFFDKQIFEEAFGPLISEMAATAIHDALINLREEEEIRKVAFGWKFSFFFILTLGRRTQPEIAGFSFSRETAERRAGNADNRPYSNRG